MATLTETANISRKVIKFGGVFIIAMIIGRFGLEAGVEYWKKTHPKPPPAPDIAFGALPMISFPKKILPEGLVYQLELPSGVFGAFPDRAAVYLMPEKRPRLLALDQAIEDAKDLGFKDKPEARSEVIYRFKKTNRLTTIMDTNIYTGKFTYTTDWAVDSNFLSVKNLPQEKQAVNEVKNFLTKASLISPDMEEGQTSVAYLKSQGGSFKQTVSLSEADFIRVDLFRAKINDQYESVTPDPQQGLIRAILSGNRDASRIIHIEYNYFGVNYDEFGTYPIKTPEKAYAELVSGEGYIAQLDPAVTTITVRRVELGYFESFEPQTYLQPVYIFKGDDNFVAYVQAIPPPSISPVPTN